MPVLVVGAGELGLAVLEALTKHAHRDSNDEVAVVLRPESIASQDPEKKRTISQIQSLGVRIEPGDFVNGLTDLIPVFAKYDVVIHCSGYGMRPGIQLEVSKAVLKAGVPRYFPWQFGVDYEAIGSGSAQEQFDEMLEVRALLRGQQRTKWTIISTGLFMSYLFLPEFGPVDFQTRTVRALGSWDTKVTVTQPADIALMVAEAVYVPEGTTDRVVYIGGDTISYRQLADLLDEVFQTKFKREEWDQSFLRGKQETNPDDLWTKYQIVFAEGTGVSWDKEKTLNYQRHIQLTDVASYVKQKFKSLG